MLRTIRHSIFRSIANGKINGALNLLEGGELIVLSDEDLSVADKAGAEVTFGGHGGVQGEFTVLKRRHGD